MYHEGYTEMKDPSGTTEYHYSDPNVVDKIIYPDKTQRQTVYNACYELVEEIDEEGRLIQTINPEGGSQHLIYGEKGMVLEQLDEAGSSTMYAYIEKFVQSS